MRQFIFLLNFYWIAFFRDVNSKTIFSFLFLSYQYQGLRVLTTLNPTIRALNTLINTIRYALTLWVFHILYADRLFSPLSQASLISVGLRHILIFFL